MKTIEIELTIRELNVIKLGLLEREKYWKNAKKLFGGETKPIDEVIEETAELFNKLDQRHAEESL